MNETQRYVVVWNRPPRQPVREEFLVLGGARRDTTNTTGIFHTGAKKALVAFHLLGHRVVVVSSDDRGVYRYNVHHRPSNIGDVVLGVYGTPMNEHTKIVECTYTTAIADNAWIAPMNGNPYVRAFGQFILNAVGTAPRDWGILKNQEVIEHQPGTTRIYIPQCPEVLDIVNNLETYFTQGSIPVASQPFRAYAANGQNLTIEVYRKPDGAGNDTIFYHTGMIAYWEEEPVGRPYTYAYNVEGDLAGVLLSEERHIRSHSAMQRVITDAYAQAVRAGNTAMIDCLLSTLKQGEGQLGIWTTGERIAERFHEKFGNNACITGENLVAIISAKLKRPVIGIASSGLLHTLSTSGVEQATDDPIIKGGRIAKPLGKRRTQELERALDIGRKAGLVAPFSVEYFGFTNLVEDSTDVGVHEEDNGLHRIGLHLDVFKKFDYMLAVLLHEHRHITSNAADNTRAFNDQADHDLARLALMLYNGKDQNNDAVDESG